MSASPILFRLALAAAAPALLGAPPRDLDVAVPPGAPTEWSRALPVLTPESVTARPRTPSRDGVSSRPQTSVGGGRASELRAPSVFGLVRVLTWDIEAHLAWIHSPQTPPPGGLVTGARDPAARPAVAEALYWIGLAPWLRLLLHPSQVSRIETLSHVLELGEAALPAIESALSESALAPDVQRMRSAITTFAVVARGAAAPAAATPYGRMLQRFAAEELVLAHPYDPSLAFGRRLYALGDAIAPSVAACVDHSDAFVRRNAVFALGQLRAPSATPALVRVATTSADPVCRARAVAALARGARRVDVAPLADRLAACSDPLDAIPLIQCLGRLADDRALPAILAFARNHETDGDALLAVLTALARIPTGDRDGAELRWIASIETKAKQTPGAWRPRDVGARGQADIPDPDWLRADTIRRLARLARARLQSEPALADEICGWAETLPAPPPPVVPPRGPKGAPPQPAPAPPAAPASLPPPVSRLASSVLRSVPPYAQLVTLETFRLLGAKGAAALARVVAEADADPQLRAYAIEMLPGDARTESARTIARDPSAPSAMRTFALDLLDRDDDASAATIARAWLDADFTGKRAIADSEARARVVAALRALGQRGKLTPGELVDALPLLRPGAAVREPEREMLRGKALEIVNIAAAARTPDPTPARVQELVALVIAQKLNPSLEPADGPRLFVEVMKQLVSLAERRADKRYREVVADAICDVCLRFHRQAVRLEVHPEIPLEETLCFELARTGATAAVDALGALSADDEVPRRAAVCLALAATGRREAGRYLLLRLTDSDPFVRLCAYESLKRLTGQDFFADWLYGPEAERLEARAQWHQWIVSQR